MYRKTLNRHKASVNNFLHSYLNVLKIVDFIVKNMKNTEQRTSVLSIQFIYTKIGWNDFVSETSANIIIAIKKTNLRHLRLFQLRNILKLLHILYEINNLTKLSENGGKYISKMTKKGCRLICSTSSISKSYLNISLGNVCLDLSLHLSWDMYDTQNVKIRHKKLIKREWNMCSCCTLVIERDIREIHEHHNGDEPFG